jgi:hypothetical protein
MQSWFRRMIYRIFRVVGSSREAVDPDLQT